MRIHLLTIGFALLLSAGFGQVQRPVLVGIDITKPILSLVTPNRPAFRVAEAMIKIPIPNRHFLSVVGGYGQYRSDVAFRNVFIEAEGFYLKAGSEKFVDTDVTIGWHGLTVLSYETASFLLSGPVFGDYTATVYNRRRVAVGLEGFVAYQRILSKRWVARLAGRVTVATLFGPRHESVPILFVPGVGVVTGDSPAYSVGLGVHLLYRTNPISSVTTSSQ